MTDTLAEPKIAPSNAVAGIDEPAIVLTDARRFDEFYERIAAEARGLNVDIGTKRGRDAIASMAYKVSRTKTALDDAGKKLTEEARGRIAVIDKHRREMRDRLDALRDEVRAPLTAWEEAEAARVQACAVKMEQLRRLGRSEVGETSETTKHRIETVKNIEITEAEFRDELPAALSLRDASLEALHVAMERTLREEREREELERLRAEVAARAEADRKAAEEAARAKEKAERAERERQAAEAAERARQEEIARAAREAEERARREVEAKARAEQEERERVAREEAAKAAAAQAAREREHEERLAAERRAREEAEATARREQEKREAAERQRQEDERRERVEAERRAADRAHRGKVMGAAKDALMEHAGIDEDAAKKIVLAIAAHSIPAVSIRF